MKSFQNTFLAHISDFLDNRINLRRGERKKVLLLQANIFIIISVLLILKPVFTSIMLAYHGVGIMPIAYMSIAISAVLVNMLLSTIGRNVLLITSIKYNHIIHIITLGIASYLLYIGFMGGMLSILLYVYISLFALVTVTYFYQYCQSLLTIRDAKRLYAYIGSGAIAGGVFGGYFTSFLIPYVGNSGLVAISALLLIISGAIMLKIHTIYKEDLDNSLSIETSEKTSSSSFRALTNRHVLNIAMIIGIGVLVSKLVDYQFNYIAYSQITYEKELTAFFGFWFSTINLIGLAIQIFFVTRIVDRLGVTKSIAIMPVFLLIGSGLVLIFPILAFGILVKLIEGSLKQSVYKTATEINIMPLSTALRNRAKTLVDVVVDSLATGLAGILIYFLINKSDLPFVYVGVVTFGCILIWLFFVIRSRKSYTEELSKMVSGSNRPLAETERIDSQAKKLFLDEYLKKNKSEDKDSRSILLELTRHEEVNVRKAAILRYVKEFKVRAVKDLLHCTEDKSFSVRKAVFFAMLMTARTEEEVDKIYEGQSVTNYVIITSALAEAIGNNSSQNKLYKLPNRIEEAYGLLSIQVDIKNSEQLYGQIFRAITISKYFKRYPLISEAIKNSMDHELQLEALKSIGYSKATRLFDHLIVEDIHIENLPEFYRVIAEFPNRLLAKIKKLREQGSRFMNRYLPALEYIDDQKHVNFLFLLLDGKNLKTRRIALRAINESRKRHNHLAFNQQKNKRRLRNEINLLKGLSSAIVRIKNLQKKDENVEYNFHLNNVKKGVQKQINRSILNVFIYLSLITQRDEMKLIYNAIKSNRKDAALDFLDGILEYKVRALVLPVLDLVINKRFTETDLQLIRQPLFTQKKMILLLRKLKDTKIVEEYFLAGQKLIESKLNRSLKLNIK